MKLQTRLADLEKQRQMALAAAGNIEEDNFVSRLLRTISDLFDSELYSDLTVALDGTDIRCHRFVLAARSDSWGVKDLAQTSELDLRGQFMHSKHCLATINRGGKCGWSSLQLCSFPFISADIPYDVGHAMLKWVYTDNIDTQQDENFLLDLLRVSSKFKLTPLSDRLAC